jgi:RNA polymerase sigma-70 factor, ECF subfamily
VSRAVHEPLVCQTDWVDHCRSGDVAAWRVLYETHLPVVYRVARRMAVPDADFGDLCQEVFLRIHRGLARFRGDAQFSTWLYRITLHEIARAGRARALRTAVLSLFGGSPATEAASPSLETQLERAEASAELERILALLRPRHRQVFVLFELEELPLPQIAEVLGCPLETVRSRLRHARAEFSRLCRQRQLAARGGAP